MIRIDEIYNHTFWPWIDKHLPGHRMFFCDPPGSTNPVNLYNFGRDDINETNFVFFHDQEPVDIDLYRNLFDTVLIRCVDILFDQNALACVREKIMPCNLQLKDIADIRTKHKSLSFKAHVVVSEKGSNVQTLVEQYGWTPHYYFYHGWACLDWYRGYDKTFLIPRARDRHPTTTFLSPNRIVGGNRNHRVLFLYHLFKHRLDYNYFSAPRICVYENQNIEHIAQQYCNRYPDIVQILKDAELPKTFAGELTQQMTSCWLTNFQEARDSLLYVPTETVYFGQRLHLTEKTFKAIALEMPFVLVAPCGSLEYLRSYGFKTFDAVFDESYDQESDDMVRLEKIAKLLHDLNSLSLHERQQIHRACLPMVEYNYNHFYHGDFAKILWQELQGMLDVLRN